MRTIVLRSLLVIFLGFTPIASNAQSFGDPKPGFSGTFQCGAIFLKTNSQLLTEGNDHPIENLDGPADSYDIINVLATIYLNYKFEGGTSVYFGNPLEVGERFALNFGLSHPIGTSTLDIAVIWLPIEEVWKNPYQTGSTRDETDVDAYGLSLKWQQIAGMPWRVDYDIKRTDIEDDEIGRLEDDLQRDGWTHELSGRYTFSIRPDLNLSPEFKYTYGDKEGLANSHHGVELGILLQRVKPPWVFIGLASGFFNHYQKSHPLFNKTRQESGITTFAQAMRMNLFGVNRLFANLGIGYVWSDSNINFFDSQSIIGLTTIGITF